MKSLIPLSLMILLVAVGGFLVTRKSQWEKEVVVEKYEVKDYCDKVNQNGFGCVCDSVYYTNDDGERNYRMKCKGDKPSNIPIPRL